MLIRDGDYSYSMALTYYNQHDLEKFYVACAVSFPSRVATIAKQRTKDITVVQINCVVKCLSMLEALLPFVMIKALHVCLILLVSFSHYSGEHDQFSLAQSSAQHPAAVNIDWRSQQIHCSV